MRCPRFTIRNLLLIVLFVAVAVAALREATDGWDSSLFGLTFLILLTAVLLAVHRTDRKRAYWLGFVLFGWTYLVASLITPIEARLPTTKALAYLDSKLPGRERIWLTEVLATSNTTNPNTIQAVAFSPQGSTLTTSSQGVVRRWDVTTSKLLAGPNGTTENFVHIGHSLLVLVIALLGGRLSRYLYKSGQEEQVRPPNDSTSAVPNAHREGS
jgi:hypothetical protein